MVSYRRLQQYAIAISIVSILYNAAEGAVSIGLGAESASRSLVFFGIQSGIEVASAAVVLWRFRRVAKPGEEGNVVLSAANLRVERVGTWSIGILIAMLALATEITAIVGLAKHSEPDSSNASLIISASALVIMVLIWLPKVTLARRLNSSTMKGEATCSLSCIQITVVLFVGSLVFRLWKGGWWVDSATSLVLGILFAREAWKMLTWVQNSEFNGGCCGECNTKNSLPRIEKDAELVEQYRDLCECCSEKEECRESSTCKCSVDDVNGNRLTKDPCCALVTPNGGACCTREVLQGPRPRRQAQRTQQEDVRDAFDGNCCSKGDAVTPGDRDTDACCKAVDPTPAPSVNSAPISGPYGPGQPKLLSTSCCQKGCC